MSTINYVHCSRCARDITNQCKTQEHSPSLSLHALSVVQKLCLFFMLQQIRSFCHGIYIQCVQQKNLLDTQFHSLVKDPFFGHTADILKNLSSLSWCALALGTRSRTIAALGSKLWSCKEGMPLKGFLIHPCPTQAWNGVS